MFERFRLLQSAAELHLDSRAGNHIPNVVQPNPSALHIEQYKRYRADWGNFWSNRQPAVGVYNCVGHIFAARRTAVDAKHVGRILQEDRYRRIKEDEVPQVDDIVVYTSKSFGIVHVGRVIKVEPLGLVRGKEMLLATVNTIRVLSKWNDFMGEDEHLVLDVVYLKSKQWTGEVTWEIYTDRPLHE